MIAHCRNHLVVIQQPVPRRQIGGVYPVVIRKRPRINMPPGRARNLSSGLHKERVGQGGGDGLLCPGLDIPQGNLDPFVILLGNLRLNG